MKKIYLSVLTVLISMVSFSQECTNEYYLMDRNYIGLFKLECPTGNPAVQYVGLDANGWSCVVTPPTIPTNTNQLTNGAGFITSAGVNNFSVTTALGGTPLFSEVDGSITNEIEVASQTGQSGKVLSTNGSTTSWISLPSIPTINSNVSRTLNSNFTISSNTDANVSYSINASWTLNALLSGTGTAFLEYSLNNGSTWITANQVSKTLNLLTVAGADDMNLTGFIPAQSSPATLTRIRTTSTNMTITYVRGQERY